MKPFLYSLALVTTLTSLPISAFAGETQCEIVLMEVIKDQNGRGGTTVASYRPAKDFIDSVFNAEKEVIYKIDDHPIRALMCSRFDIIPSKSDYPILATGIPFVLSQNFDMKDSDLLTVYYKNGAFQYDYKGPGLSEETQDLLETRLAAFSEKDHGLDKKEMKQKEKSEKKQAENKDKKDTDSEAGE